MNIKPVKNSSKGKDRTIVGKDNKRNARNMSHKYIIDPEDIRKFRDTMINKSLDRIYKTKIKCLVSGNDGSLISDAWLGNSEFIKSRVLECIPTRDVRLDMSLAMDMNGNRGLPRGKTIEISGSEENMKSARLYQFYADLQQDPRGAIIHHFESESKIQPRYMKIAGVDLSSIIISQPNFIEAMHYKIADELVSFIKDRDKMIYKYLTDNNLLKKSTTHDELDKLMFQGCLSFPILVFGTDSIGNQQSQIAWKKDQKSGISSKTPGASAAALAELFRSIKSMIGTTMALYLYVNHTKEVLDIGRGGSYGKMTDTTGGRAVKLMSDIRFDQLAGTNGETKTSLYTVTRDRKEIIIGKWLTVRFLKNSIIETSKTKIHNILFHYKYGFNIGVSYLLALKDAGYISGKVHLNNSQRTTLKLPNGNTVKVTINEFHKLLKEHKDIRNTFRRIVQNHVNENAVLVRDDI